MERVGNNDNVACLKSELKSNCVSTWCKKKCYIEKKKQLFFKGKISPACGSPNRLKLYLLDFRLHTKEQSGY